MIPTRSDINFTNTDGISCFFNHEVMTESDKKEFFASDKYEETISENNSSFLFNDIIFKANFIKTFNTIESKLDLSDNEVVLEMGAAHAWASVLLKKKYPSCYVIASDLVPDALKHSRKYEAFLSTYLDEKWSFNCRDIPFKNDQFDKVFTFAAFHHFGESGDYTKVLEEIVRILKPKGKLVLLYEPSAPEYLYKFAFNRVNKKRGDGVDEDVLVISRLKDIAKKLSCEFKSEYFPIYLYRDTLGSFNYYYLLSKLRIFQSLSINCINIVIQKK